MRTRIILGLVVLCLMVSPAFAGTKPFKGKLHNVGDSGSYEAWTVKLEETKRSSNDKMLLIKVNVASPKGAAVGPIHWVVEMADGKRIKGSGRGFDETPKLINGSIEAGKSETGYVGFKVPANAGELKVLYQPYSFMEPTLGFKVTG